MNALRTDVVYASEDAHNIGYPVRVLDSRKWTALPSSTGAGEEWLLLEADDRSVPDDVEFGPLCLSWEEFHGGLHGWQALMTFQWESLPEDGDAASIEIANRVTQMGSRHLATGDAHLYIQPLNSRRLLCTWQEYPKLWLDRFNNR